MVREVIYIDETAFIALMNKDNKYHRQAIESVRTLLNRTIKFTTSYLTIIEAVSELTKEKGHKTAQKLLEFLKNEGIDILKENDSIRKNTECNFIKDNGHGSSSMHAHYHVATMHYYGIHKIFTFSSHFEKLEVVRTVGGR